MDRRRRLAARHRLAPAHHADGPVDVARSLVALHSTDPASVVLAVAARSPGAAAADVDAALHDTGELTRLLAMRRTVWVVPTELVPIITAACTRGVARNERRRLVQDIEAHGIAKRGATWLTAVEGDVLAAMKDLGEAVGSELSKAVPALKATYTAAPGKAYERAVAVSSRVLGLLAADGHLVRGRPRGTWLSTQYRWRLAPEHEVLDEADAQAELARRWLAAFGPAPASDLKWWAGWTAGATAKALAAAGEVPDPDPGEVEPWAALLPALDPTPMGWQERSWYLGEHGPLLFDGTGNVGPTVWWDGRIVGGWAQRPTGEVVWRLLEDVGGAGRAAIDAEASRVTALLDGTVLAPRGRGASPVERELSS